MNPFLALALREAGKALERPARKFSAKLLRRRAEKLRKKLDEKENPPDTTGAA